jgi:uroporphyrinogen-III synthase
MQPMTTGPLAGYTIGVTADRRWEEQAQLLERRGAKVIHGPAIRTLPLSDEAALRDATQAVVDHRPDVVVLTTGLGTRGWFAAAESMGMGEDLHDVLVGAPIYARGPKAAGAAITAGLEVAWKAPDAQAREIARRLITEDAEGRLPGRRVVIQLDGSEDTWICDELEAAGFDVVAVPIYRWKLPADPAPALRLAQCVVDGTVDAVTFTAGPTIANFVMLADDAGILEPMLASFNEGRVSAVSVGPVCSARARALGIVALIEPDRPRLGAMVQACAAAFAERCRPIRLGGHDLMVQGRLVVVDEATSITLTDRERDVLDALAERPGVVHSKAALLASVWGGRESDEHVVEVTVGRLRHRLGGAGAGVETVVRRGYRLAPD